MSRRSSLLIVTGLAGSSILWAQDNRAPSVPQLRLFPAPAISTSGPAGSGPFNIPTTDGGFTVTRRGRLQRHKSGNACGSLPGLGEPGRVVDTIAYVESGQRLLLLYDTFVPNYVYPHTTITHLAYLATSNCRVVWTRKLQGPGMRRQFEVVAEGRAIYVCGQDQLSSMDSSSGKLRWLHNVRGDNIFTCDFEGDSVRRVHRRGVGPIIEKRTGRLLRRWE